jgi:hypothetical protein
MEKEEAMEVEAKKDEVVAEPNAKTEEKEKIIPYKNLVQST